MSDAKLRLEWREVPDTDGQVWVADVGRFRISVFMSARGWPWEIGFAYDEYGVVSTFKRQNLICPETETREASMLAAEAAAFRLLAEAVGAFGVVAPPPFIVVNEGSVFGRGQCVALVRGIHTAEISAGTDGEAVSLGAALIAAGLKGGG